MTILAQLFSGSRFSSTASRLMLGVALGSVIVIGQAAAQGLGSVIGLLALAGRHGVPGSGEHETVQWRGGDGQVRRARIAKVWFTEGKRNELA